MSATELEIAIAMASLGISNLAKEGDLMPLSSTTLELVYGSMEYVRSVFGTEDITRSMLYQYYDNARKTWHICDRTGLTNSDIRQWTKRHDVGPLHYNIPLSQPLAIFFKEAEHMFIFKLQFGK